MNGASAKVGYRYQDWCAMYFLLNRYDKNQVLLEYIFCEQGLLDFEILSRSKFEGYQVKLASNVQATEVNKIFSYYSIKANGSNKDKRFFRFIFSKSPKHSLNYLLLKLSGNKGVKGYFKKTENYVNAAIKDIDVSNLHIRHSFYSRKRIKDLVIGIANRIIRNTISNKNNFYSNTVDNFIARLRDEIDKTSCQNKEEDRKFSKENLEELIINVLENSRQKKLVNNQIKIEQLNINIAPIIKSTIKKKTRLKNSPMISKEESIKNKTEGKIIKSEYE